VRQAKILEVLFIETEVQYCMTINLSDKTKSQYETKRERDNKIKQMRKVISRWDKKELQDYVFNKNKTHPSSDAGMAAILERFIDTNEFQIGHMSEDLKVGFDIILSIAKNKRIYFHTTDLIYMFVKHFEDVIHSYDRQSAQTYYHKLIKAYENSVNMVRRKLEIEKEIRVKYK